MIIILNSHKSDFNGYIRVIYRVINLKPEYFEIETSA